MARRTTSAHEPQSSRQDLAAVIKRARDLMRTDPGLNGDLDRLPQLAWLLFLKAFDDLEEDRAALDPQHTPLLSNGYRWRDWVGDQRRTGDTLLKFVNNDLLPMLRALKSSSTDRESADVVSSVFRGIENRMRSGYQLRALVDELEKVHFTSSDDIHTMAFLYESMLREMRDAAGDSGEFYTPRPVIRFMVEQVAPRLGEVVLDPAAGTGGFLVETLEHLRAEVDSVAKRRKLYGSVRGFEKKPLPYLLATMNLLLHQVDVPHLVLDNALTRMVTDKSKASQVNVVLTNPPFGGAESSDVVKAFPKAYQTAETAWLFLYAVMEKLKPGGRCGMVVPNGVLFDTGVGVRIKERLLDTCDVHTIVRLPDGVFAPYTTIPANLVFFNKGRPTSEVWYYEIRPFGGRKRYSKTMPMQYEEFAACQEWWNSSTRVETDRAWRVPVAQIRDANFNLDVRNPWIGEDLSHRPPAELIQDLVEVEHEILGVLEQLQRELGQ